MTSNLAYCNSRGVKPAGNRKEPSHEPSRTTPPADPVGPDPPLLMDKYLRRVTKGVKRLCLCTRFGGRCAGGRLLKHWRAVSLRQWGEGLEG